STAPGAGRRRAAAAAAARPPRRAPTAHPRAAAARRAAPARPAPRSARTPSTRRPPSDLPPPSLPLPRAVVAGRRARAAASGRDAAGLAARAARDHAPPGPARCQPPETAPVDSAPGYDASVARPRSRFACTECGARAPRWMGRCPECGAWSSLVEEPEAPARGAGGRARGMASGGGAEAGGPVPLRAIEPEARPRLATGLPELDRVI